MVRQKTHFEQVPLEMVRKMIAEQIQREEYTPGEVATGSDAVKASPQDTHDKSPAESSVLPPLEVWTVW